MQVKECALMDMLAIVDRPFVTCMFIFLVSSLTQHFVHIYSMSGEQLTFIINLIIYYWYGVLYIIDLK